MWKYVSRRVRETFERSVKLFEKRTATGIVNTIANPPEEKNERTRQCCFTAPLRCLKSFRKEYSTNNEKCTFNHLSGSWLGAFTWSGALVLGWYTGQLIHLRLKYFKNNKKTQLNSLWSAVYPYAKCIRNPILLNTASEIHNIVKQLTPVEVHLISNDKESGKEASTSSHSTSSDASDGFEATLNYIENSLGWAAIHNGQLQDGLKLLRSAANRNHAPALYNLALCYEMGIGSAVNEKKAMELYRSAASLKHPGALYNLGIYYAQGRGGLNKDQKIAIRLLRVAAVQGHEVAINALKFLEEDYSEPQMDTDLDLQSIFQCSVFSTNVEPPTLSSLFLQDVNYLQAPNYNTAQVIF